MVHPPADGLAWLNGTMWSSSPMCLSQYDSIAAVNRVHQGGREVFAGDWCFTRRVDQVEHRCERPLSDRHQALPPRSTRQRPRLFTIQRSVSEQVAGCHLLELRLRPGLLPRQYMP